MVGIDVVSQSIDEGAIAARLPPGAGVRGARALPADHPAGVGHRPLGQARAQRRDGRGAGRRRGGGAPAVPVAARLRDRLRRGHRRARGAHRHRLRGREHVPLAGHLATRDEGLPARLGPLRGVLRQHHDRPLPRRDRPVRPRGDGRAARRPAAARPHDRRQRVGQGRAPRARPRQPAVRPVPRAAGRPRLRRPHRRRDQHPQGRRPARPARPTCWRRWRSARLHFAAAGDPGWRVRHCPRD